MNNYQASFTNQRQITFPCTNLNAAKLEAKQYAIKNNLYVSNVKQRG